MEPLSEVVKRALQERLKEKAGSPSPQSETVEGHAPAEEFPSEPFPCPACGQLLAPTCRVCVACRHIINPAEIARPEEKVFLAAPAPPQEPKPQPVRYPWTIFFAVLGVTILITMILAGLMEQQKAQMVMWGADVLAGIWVFFDAVRKGIPRPMRWGVGTILLTAFILPWYLARRNKRQSPVPFVEAEVGRVTRFLAFALIVFFLFSAILYVVKGPAPGDMDLQRILMPK